MMDDFDDSLKAWDSHPSQEFPGYQLDCDNNRIDFSGLFFALQAFVRRGCKQQDDG